MLGYFPKGKVRDSKKLSATAREKIFQSLAEAQVRSEISFAVSFSRARMIDRKGISFAIRHALAQSLKKLGIRANETLVLLDGALRAPSQFTRQKTIIKGDEKEAVIALASIVAKVSRDRKMIVFSRKYPQYGFEKHKGYGTKAHYRALKKNGPSAIHRRSFLKNLAV